MAEENIDNTVTGNGLFNTKIPGLSDAADIQAALRLYHYGSYTYDGANTNPTLLPNPSIAKHLQNLVDADAAEVVNRNAAITTHNLDTTDVHGIANTANLATQSYVTTAISSAISGAVGGYPDLAGNGIDWNSLDERFDLEPSIANSGTVITKTSDFVLNVNDVSKTILLSTSVPMNLTVPANSSVEIPVGYHYNFVEIGTGRTTFFAAPGVTIGSKNNQMFLDGQYSKGTLVKISTNDWVLFGDIYEGVAVAPTPVPVAPTPVPVAPVPVPTPTAQPVAPTPTPIVQPVAPTPIVEPTPTPTPTPIVQPIAPVASCGIMPNVIGMTNNDAGAAIVAQEIQYEFTYFTGVGATPQNDGTVQSQDPAPGTNVGCGFVYQAGVTLYDMRLVNPTTPTPVVTPVTPTPIVTPVAPTLSCPPPGDTSGSFSDPCSFDPTRCCDSDGRPYVPTTPTPIVTPVAPVAPVCTPTSYTENRICNGTSTPVTVYVLADCSEVWDCPGVTPVAPTPIVTPVAPVTETSREILTSCQSDSNCNSYLSQDVRIYYSNGTSILSTECCEPVVNPVAPTPIVTPVAPTPIVTPVGPTPAAPVCDYTDAPTYCLNVDAQGNGDAYQRSWTAGCPDVYLGRSFCGVAPTPSPTPVPAPAPVPVSPVIPTAPQQCCQDDDSGFCSGGNYYISQYDPCTSGSCSPRLDVANAPWCIAQPTPVAASPAPTPVAESPTPVASSNCPVECCYSPYDPETGTYSTVCNTYTVPCDQVNGWC